VREVNAVWRALRRDFINAEDSMRKFSAPPYELCGWTELLSSAFEMALKRNITVYDSYTWS